MLGDYQAFFLTIGYSNIPSYKGMCIMFIHMRENLNAVELLWLLNFYIHIAMFT